MTQGQEQTLALIERFGIVDSSGRPHVPHGCLTYQADLLVHVCFDDFPDVGQFAHMNLMSDVRWRILADIAEGKEPARGSVDSNSAQQTGAGYLYRPKDFLRGWSILFDERDWPPRSEVGTMGRLLVESMLRDIRLGPCSFRRATGDEERAGADLVVSDAERQSRLSRIFPMLPTTFSIEVKSRDRDKRFPALFFQISETNSDRKHL